MFPFESHRDSRNDPEAVSTTTTDSLSRNSPILPTHHQYSPITNTSDNINNEKTTHSNVITSLLSRIFALFRQPQDTSDDLPPPQYFDIPGSINSFKFISMPIWIEDIDDTTDRTSRNNIVTSFLSRTFSGIHTAYNATTKFISQQIKSATLPAKIPQFTYLSVTDPEGFEIRYPCYPLHHQSLETYVSTVIHLMEILTQPQTIPDIEWIHPKLSGTVKYSPCIDAVTIKVLLEHYGIDIDKIVKNNYKDEHLRNQFQDVIKHLLLLATFGDYEEMDRIETADIIYPKKSDVINNSLFRLREYAFVQATLLMESITKSNSADIWDRINSTKLVRTVAICHLIMKQDSICNTVLERKMFDMAQHLFHITFITTKVNHYGAYILALGIQSIFHWTDFDPVELLKVLEISLDMSIVPTRVNHCIALEHCLPNLWPHRRINVATFESLTGGINAPPIPIPVCGYWTAGSRNPSKLYFRNLNCNGGVNCSLRCHDVFDGDSDNTMALKRCREKHKHKSSVDIYNLRDHYILQKGMFELRFDWRILAIFFTMAAILVGIIVYQNVLMDVDSKTDIRMVFNLLIAVFTGLATALNKIYWPETSFHDFITCRRVIDKFSVVCRLQNTCTGCLTAHLLNKHGVIVWSASGGHLSLTGQAFDTSKFNNLIIDRDGITTCLHRAGFFIVHAFETLANDYEDYMENNFVDSTMFPCDKLLKATIKVQERLYLAKSKVAFLVKTGKSYSGFADVRGVVYYYSDNSCKLHWLKKPVLVQPRTTPITPTNFIR